MGLDALEFSILLPVCDERENLGPLLEEIEATFRPLGKTWEVIAVDDGSRDGSPEALEALRVRHKELRVYRHRRNFGQSAALATALARARGDVVITMDADRQDDPAELPRMIAALNGRVDAVLGVRRRRMDSLSRRVASRVANSFRDWITGVPVRDAGCCMRVLRREALREIPLFNGFHRFLPTLLLHRGYRVVEIEVNHRPRQAGRSKYGVRNRLWRGLRDCLAMRWMRARTFPGERVIEEASSRE
jgi:dolichol-phosphate mannosyltransferase